MITHDCDGCDYQIIREDGEHCEKDPYDKDPLCPLVPTFRKLADPIIIIIPTTPPSNNQFIGRNNRWNYQKYKKEWSVLMRAGMKDIPNAPIQKSIVHINYTFPTRVRHDPDNFSGKLILDPLVQFGIIADDSFNNIDLVLTAEYKKKVKETKITITEVNNG